MKKKIIPLITTLIVMALALSACVVPFQGVVRGSGNIVSETRDVSDFRKIQLDGAGTLTITQGETESLVIEADDNILSELTSNVVGSTLVLGIEEDWWQRAVIPTREINYTLTVINLSDITINGAADLHLDDFQTDSLTIEINGAGNIDVTDLSADNLEIQVNGTANSQLSGEVDDMSVTVNGMGNVEAGDLLATAADVEINGIGNCTVWTSESMSITISGGGSLSYYGYPTISQDISGAGDIVSLGEK